MVQFSPEVADQLVRAAESAASALRDQGGARSQLATHACEGFSGGHARTFSELCVAESEGRGRLAGVLEDLVPQVEHAKQQYFEEKARQENLAAWNAREESRQRSRALEAVGAPMVETWDPRPAVTPIAPPTIDAAFAPVSRSRAAGGGGGGGPVAADPVRLRSFVASARSQDQVLHGEDARLRGAWASFTGSCAWARIGNASAISSFSQLLSENEADATWLEGVAAGFERAAQGTWKWLDGLLGITPDSSLPPGLSWGAWAGGHLLTAGGVTIDIWLQKLTRSAPRAGWIPKSLRFVGSKLPFTRGPISWMTGFTSWNATNMGRFAPKASIPTYPVHKFFYNLGQNRVPRPFQASAAGKLGAAGRIMGPLGGLLSGGTAAYSQWQEDAQDSNMRTAERVGRTAAVGVSVGAGAIGGAALGATIGSAVPLVGTVVGGLVGGLIGGFAGTAAGQWLGDQIKDIAGKATQGIADAASEIGSGLAAGAQTVGKFFGGLFST